jgi:hypothetical protein
MFGIPPDGGLMTTILGAVLAFAMAGAPPALASRSGPPATPAQLVAQSSWIFAGRVLRVERSSEGSPIGTTHVTFTAVSDLRLRGTPPTRVVVIGLRSRAFEVPITPGSVLIFFGEPGQFPPDSGIDGYFHDVRPLSDLKVVQELIRQAQKQE